MQRLFPDNLFVPPKMGTGNRLVVAEAPGETESIEGIPLVGSSGKMFDSLCRKAGISRDSLTITNTILCRPKDNIYPTDDKARAYCSEKEGNEIVSFCYERHLKPLLEARPWNRIDAIGGHSLKVLTGYEGIMRWRGSPLPLKGETVPKVMPTLHPSYLMRDSTMIPSVISDLQKGIQVPPEHYNTQPTLEEVQAFQYKRFSYDIETHGFTGQIICVGLCGAVHNAIVVPFRGAYIAELKRIFKDAEMVIGFNNIAFDTPHLEEALGITIKAFHVDAMLLHHSIAPDEPHSLEHVASIYSQKPAWKHLSGKDLLLYCARDTDTTLQITNAMVPVVKQQKLWDLYRLVYIPLAKICKLMSDTGLKVDPNRIHLARKRFEQELKDLESLLPKELQPYDKAIRKREPAPPGTLGKSGKPIKYIHIPATERVVPWDSPKAVETYLYETLKLPVQRHPKTKKTTTDKNALDRLFKQTQRPEIDAIRKVRQLGELIGTFLQDETQNKQVASGRIHSSFLVHGTSTGRLASSGPNLQNQPIKARYIYVPSHSDWCFVEADFSSLENRLAAWYAGDTERLRRLSDPTFDEHRWLASHVFNVPEDQVTKEQRKLGKIANHGCVTGDHEVLTSQGWVRFDAYDFKTPIAEWDAKTNQLIFRSPIAYINEEVDEDLITINQRSLQAVVTANHTFPVRSSWEDSIYYTKRQVGDLHSARIPVHGWLGGREFCSDLDIQQDVAIQADATIHQNSNRATFHLVKPRKQRRIEELFGVKGRPCGCHPTGLIYHVTVPFVVIDSTKTFTSKLLDLSLRQKNLFLQEIMKWDGTINESRNSKVYLTTNYECAKWVQTVAHTVNQQGLLRKHIKSQNSFGTKPIYSVSINDFEHSRISQENCTATPYRGRIYCVTTSTGYFLCRYKDTVFVSGNSDGAMGPRKLAITHGLPEKEARNLILKWKEVNPRSAKWQEETGNTATSKGVLTNAFGRKRWFWSHGSYTEGIRFLPQSTGADILYRSLISLMYERIGWPAELALQATPALYPLPQPARLTLVVHDSILVECPLSLREDVIETLKKAMMQPWPELAGYVIPVEVKFGDAGESWGELHT
jgi:uracil-DNA glycosylase family 4